MYLFNKMEMDVKVWIRLITEFVSAEQRLSAFVVSVLVGASVLMAPLLRLVPMAVLFGVFLYMGISSIDGIQFFERLKLVFMPVKHHSQANYVRRVSRVVDVLMKSISLLPY